LLFVLVLGVNVCEAQTKCDYPTRIADFYIDVTSDFDGEIRKETYDNQTYVLTGKTCEGPFHLKVVRPDGTISAEYDYKRGELFEDKQMIEMPDPPHEIRIAIDTVYKAIRL